MASELTTPTVAEEPQLDIWLNALAAIRDGNTAYLLKDPAYWQTQIDALKATALHNQEAKITDPAADIQAFGE